MNHCSRLLLFPILFFGCFAAQTFAQDLYETDHVSEIEINFYYSSWDAILDGYMANESDKRILADVTINGILYDSVGVRYKGNSSYRPEQIKNPLNIKLNYVKDQDYQGYYTLKLSNGFKDPSFVREVLALEIARKYMPAALAGYANITINGTLVGLYTNVQSVNDVFTQEHYYSEDRPLFEGAGDGPPPPGCFHNIWGYMGTDSTDCYPHYYDSKSGDHYTYLINFLDRFNNDPNAMEELYNVDRHLWAMAFDIALVNLDAPVSMPHNFYLYYDATNRFHYIKWDLNECFGIFTRLRNNQLDITQMQQLDPYVSNNPNSPILYKVWQNSRWKKMYMAHMITLMEENISNNWYMERAVELQMSIDEAVRNDPNKFFTYNQTVNNLNYSIGPLVGISQLMDARATYLNSTAYFQFTQPDISNISNIPASITPNSDVIIIADISNADYAILSYRDALGGRFEKAEMFDDGSHNDGVAGDGTWGATIPVNTTYIDYYIYAENSDAGKFSPSRAEYEYYTLTASGDIVINEFLASNDNTKADQAGEFDDWIELYNNTESAISMNGYYLSDKLEFPYKWQFPDTTIAADGYLIVWADKDTLQEGLHSNFKLSASGEAIILSDASEMMQDQVIFSMQTTDISSGRYINGTGDFVAMKPTFAAENDFTLDNFQLKNLIPKLSLYPNPATNRLNISINDTQVHEITMYNIFGQLIDKWHFQASETIDISNLSPGIYFINVDGLGSGKFIKR